MVQIYLFKKTYGTIIAGTGTNFLAFFPLLFNFPACIHADPDPQPCWEYRFSFKFNLMK